MLLLLVLYPLFELPVISSAYQKGWNKATAFGRKHAYPARPRPEGILNYSHTVTNEFTAGWNAAVFYYMKFGRSPPMLHHNTMPNELETKRNTAIADLAKSEDLAMMFT